MTRLPNPGSDNGVWGDILNAFLGVEHNADGTLKASGSLATKADNDAVVHLAGTETITGDKNFTGALQQSGAAVASDGAVVHLAGTETVTGNKNFTGTLQNGGSAVAIDSTVAHLAGTETITGNKNFTGTLQHNSSAVVDTTDVRLTNQAGYYPPQAYGFFAMTVSARHATSSSFYGMYITRVWIPAGNAISTVSAYVTSAGVLGTPGSNNGFALYDDDGASIGSIPNYDSFWTTTGWVTATLTTPLAAQSTGRFIYVACLGSGNSPSPTFLSAQQTGSSALGGLGLNATKRHNLYNGVSSFPASFNPNTYASSSEYVPVIGFA